MMMMRKNRRAGCTGSLSIEMLVAVAIIAALVNVLAVFGRSFKKVDDYRWTQHLVLAAGQSQMDAIAATGEPIDKQTFERLWPKVTCTVVRSEGQGQWQGLQKVQLDLSAVSRHKPVTVTLTRYLPNHEEAPL